MSLEFAWVGEEAYDRVALTRMRCYAPATRTLERYEAGMNLDGRQKPGDFLLATRGGMDLGTVTSLSLNMWMRGARLPCQGIAYVGTIKTHRRGGADNQRGIASQLMDAALAKGREREQVVTALMPFRASFYEHFGYGNAEQRVEWTIPLSILPRGEFNGYRFYESGDDARLIELRALEARQGQCDVETDAAALANWQRSWPDAMVFVDEPTPGGAIEAYVYAVQEQGTTITTLAIEDWAASSPVAMQRMLHLLASLKDQYSFVRITLPADLPLNALLRESQIPHRQVDHPVAAARPYTRMQIRVLDHRRLLEAMTLPAIANGKLTVNIRETEGTISKLAIEFESGKLRVRPATGDADVEMTDVRWASIVSGHLCATAAHRYGLVRSISAEALALLDAFAEGPLPFCQEYF